jgi:RNA polymerase sigma-70 factor, ECF subfamily
MAQAYGGLTWGRGARDAARRMDVETSRQLEQARRDRFDRLTAKHRNVLHRVAMRCCSRDRAVADDLVQDTYERAWKRFDLLQDEVRVLPWLIRILHNCWIDACRKSARSAVLSVADVPDRPYTVDEPSPWQSVTVDDFHRAIEQLREPYRSVAILHDVDQLSNADIARRLAIPYATVASRLHRAHRRLQHLLRIVVDEAMED